LCYDDDSRNNVDEAKLIVAVIVDAADVVDYGILKIVPLTRAVTKMLMVSIYQVLVPNVVMGGDLAPFSTYLTRLFPMVCFPLLMIPFLLICNDKTSRLLDSLKTKQRRLLRQFRDAVENFSLIGDYRKRGLYIDMLDGKVTDVKAANRGLNLSLIHNRWFAKWLTWIFSCFYLYWGGLSVSTGDLSLGEFLNRD
jgi:hypothetical protein